ncbi:hypothetical protein DFP73DRAFT_582740 [Morchella snyderi]|nr:hypothetical protein DFP73DRAFT_582740 [Morchella snyderi]
MSFQKLILRYGAPTATLAAAVIGSGAVIFEARSGRAHALNMTDSKFEAVQSQITDLKADIQDLGAEVQDLGTEVQDLGAEMQAIQSMILETSLHTMKAIDGNKAPLRKWVERIERCRKSGGEDCGPIRKE